MKSLIATLTEPPIVRALFGSISALTLSHWSQIASIAVALLTAGYIVYRWQRDARERTCDVAACPLRHRPE